MKNVLFTTTALAALAMSGAAFAGGHASGNFGISGSTDVGYNDEKKNGIFQNTNVDIKASKDAGNGVTVSGHARLNLDWEEGTDEDGDDDSTTAEVEFKNIAVDTGVGKLEFADSFDGTGASDSFYTDRDGMSLDMQNGDGIAGLKWTGELGSFGYAIDAGNIENGSGDDWSIGLGGDLGPATVGLGFQNDSYNNATGQAVGVSADFDAGIADVGVSYITDDVGSSIGLAASAEVSPGIKIGAYYAVNDPADDFYGVTFDYSNGPLTVAVDYDTGENNILNGDDRIEVDVSYDMGNGVVGFVGWDSLETPTGGAAGDGAFYAGAEIAIADGVSATISYSEADEMGGPDFKEGTSAFLSLTY